MRKRPKARTDACERDVLIRVNDTRKRDVLTQMKETYECLSKRPANACKSDLLVHVKEKH